MKKIKPGSLVKLNGSYSFSCVEEWGVGLALRIHTGVDYKPRAVVRWCRAPVCVSEDAITDLRAVSK